VICLKFAAKVRETRFKCFSEGKFLDLPRNQVKPASAFHNIIVEFILSVAEGQQSLYHHLIWQLLVSSTEMIEIFKYSNSNTFLGERCIVSFIFRKSCTILYRY
jgi:hypothetical protein